MQSRPQDRPQDLPLTTGIIAGAVTLGAGADQAPPEWIKITPSGAAATRDGRSYSFDPAVLAARFSADATDLAVDTDHSVAILSPQGLKANVLGYVKAVEARQDGTYGRVDWIDPAQASGQIKTHRYVSPTFHHDAAGNATWLHSVALVPAPALGNMPALAHAREGNTMKAIAKALGLPETASETDCLAALAARTEVKPLAAALGLAETADAPACLTAIGTLRQGAGTKTDLVAQLQADLTVTGQRLAALTKANRDKDVGDLIEGALRDLKMVPAERASLTALCATDEGLAGVRALLAARQPALGGSGLDDIAPPTGDGHIDPVKLAAEARALVDASKGTLSISEAVMQIQATKKG